ncbi:inorganic phosphate transporter [Phaeacidiphilus oryzae]|uniref:inorganic phosphate transporter n=1 Tax=Phaeacidiphilus oryzae TaxID=348818 RepID=UPI000562F14A|nr:inorganic phosphate transporter [Phaeacidiphilus oryzae]
MEHITFLVTVVIITALAFDFTNGFHDTANAMATSISTGALRPRLAVAVSALLNFGGAFLSVQVAKTISGGIIQEHAGISPVIVFAALIGAIVWNLATWRFGMPSSSSHALYGGLIGAALIGAGLHAVDFTVVVTKIVIPLVASPIVAGIASWAATRISESITRRSDQEVVGRGFRAGQVASSALVSLAHGTSDGQKTMGVITLALVTCGALPAGSAPPLWVIVAAGLAMAFGTYSGGWRIIRAMGKGLTDIRPSQGLSAQTAAGAVILTSSHMGFGLSTTQVCTGGILGAGLGGQTTINWSLARRMVYAWGLTLPAAAVVGGLAELLASNGPAGVAAVGVLGAAFCVWIYVSSRSGRVTADNVNQVKPATTTPLPTAPAADSLQSAPAA